MTEKAWLSLPDYAIMAKYDFFISYSSKDKDIAFKIVNAIESAGYICWIAPRNIPYGTPYAAAIMEGIDECDKFIVLITKNSVQSNDVLNEVDNAHSVKKTIIPVRLTDTQLSRELQYYLSRTQWLTLPSSNPEEIVKLLNIGVAPLPVAPNQVNQTSRIIIPVCVIAAIIVIAAGVAVWWFSSDKSKDFDEVNTSLIAGEEASQQALNVDTLHSEGTNTQSEAPRNVLIEESGKDQVPKEDNHTKSTSVDLEKMKKEADQYFEDGKYEQALPLYIKISDVDKNYSHKVGYMYQNGLGTLQDHITAIQWYKKISHYHSGAHESLLALYEQLANQCVMVGNNRDAAHWYDELGAEHMNEKKYKEAAHWYELGYNTGFLPPNCKYWLGYLYYNGMGVSENREKAKTLWEEARNEGHEQAKADLEKYYQE